MKKYLVFAGLVVVLGFGFRFWSGTPFGMSSSGDEDTVSAEPKYYKAPDMSAFIQQVNQSINDRKDLQVGVSLINLNNNEQINLGVQEPFDAASTNKLITVAYFLSQVDAGKESLSSNIQGQTSKNLIEKMIVNSDNDAWKIMNDHLDRDKIQAYAQSMGLGTYSVKDNRITVSDEAKLLAKIYDKDLLTKSSRDLVLSFMKRADNRDYIVAGAGGADKVYHKSGYLRDRVHDAAIIENGQEKFVLVIFTKSSGDYDFIAGQKLFKSITSSALTVFARG